MELLLILPFAVGILIALLSRLPRRLRTTLPPFLVRFLILALFASLCAIVVRFLFYSPLPQVLTVGLWPHFAGITWFVDELSLIFCAGAVLIYLPTAWALSYRSLSALSLFHFLVGSLFGAFLAGDFFNLFVMFEVFLISSYALLFTVAHFRSAKLFIWINILGSIVFLMGIVFLYRSTNTLNFAEVSVRFASMAPAAQDAVGLLFCFAFILKAAIFPLFGWLPFVYLELPLPLLAFLASLSSKLGLYAFVRFTILTDGVCLARHRVLFLILGALTMTLGLLAAASELKLKKSLIYFSLSHTGLLFFFICLPRLSPLDSWPFPAFLFYALTDIVVTAALFFFLNSIDSQTENSKSTRWASPLFLILLLSASGFPPLAGFWGEWAFLRGALHEPAAFIFLLIYLFLGFAFVIRLWGELFFLKSIRPFFQEKAPLVLCGLYVLALAGIGLTSFSWFESAGARVKSPMGMIQIFHEGSRQVEGEREKNP